MDDQPPRPPKKQRIAARKVKLSKMPSNQKLGDSSSLNLEPRDKILEEVEQEQQPQQPTPERRRRYFQTPLRNSQAGSQQKILGPTNNNREQLETNAPQPNPFSLDDSLKVPYEFLTIRSPPIHTIILPHFTWKSITFWLSVVMLTMFLSLVGIYASREKNDLAWSCLMFQTQNKFYPRLRYNYQFWRIFVSSLFHGNISHVVLNLLGMQLYGYFCQWYFGRLRYALVVVMAIINSHLLSCLTNAVSVSSTASGLLYAFLGLKIIFFVKYRSYKPLENRRAPLYCLFGLIFAMNLVVLFVGSNVDVGGHVGTLLSYVGGLVTGLAFGGMFYHDDPKTKKEKALKYSMMALTIVLPVALLGACFGLNGEFYTDLNSAIDVLC